MSDISEALIKKQALTLLLLDIVLVVLVIAALVK